VIAFHHALTGVVVAATVNKPILALPAAFLSHLAIDMSPHWDYKLFGLTKIRRLVIGLDITASLWLIVLVAFWISQFRWLVLVGGFLALLPDAMWLPNILLDKSAPKDKQTLLHLARRFHFRIHWSKTSIGLAVMTIWLALMLFFVIKIGML